MGAMTRPVSVQGADAQTRLLPDSNQENAKIYVLCGDCANSTFIVDLK
jgi:hypothetical protein